MVVRGRLFRIRIRDDDADDLCGDGFEDEEGPAMHNRFSTQGAEKQGHSRL